MWDLSLVSLPLGTMARELGRTSPRIDLTYTQVQRPSNSPLVLLAWCILEQTNSIPQVFQFSVQPSYNSQLWAVTAGAKYVRAGEMAQ